MKCTRCHRPANPLFQCDGGSLCFYCVPSWVWKMYPGAKEQEERRQQRADQARKNFGVKEARA